MCSCCFKNEIGEGLQERQDEVVWMLCFNPEFGESVSWKVGQIEGDDHASTAADSGGQDVPVVSIRKL